MDKSGEEVIFSRLRSAITGHGGVRKVSEATGIPVGTLNKYMAGSSMPPFANVARIAAAVGADLEWFAGATPKKSQVSVLDTEAAVFAFRLVGKLVARVYKEEGVKLSADALLYEVSVFYQDLAVRADDPNDREEVETLLPWLEARVRRQIHKARDEPGTGKREAS